MNEKKKKIINIINLLLLKIILFVHKWIQLNVYTKFMVFILCLNFPKSIEIKLVQLQLKD